MMIATWQTSATEAPRGSTTTVALRPINSISVYLQFAISSVRIMELSLSDRSACLEDHRSHLLCNVVESPSSCPSSNLLDDLAIKVKDRKELLHLATQQLGQKGEKMSTFAGSNAEDDEDDHRLLARLLSQLESTKDDSSDPSEPSTRMKALTSSGAVEACAEDERGSEGAEIRIEEIVKELRIVRRQNTVTHWLLSVVIVITAVWQISEVSIILYLKDTVKHPFKVIRGWMMGSLGRSNEPDSTKSNTSLKVPLFPSVDFPSLGLNGNRED